MTELHVSPPRNFVYKKIWKDILTEWDVLSLISDNRIPFSDVDCSFVYWLYYCGLQYVMGSFHGMVFLSVGFFSYKKSLVVFKLIIYTRTHYCTDLDYSMVELVTEDILSLLLICYN